MTRGRRFAGGLLLPSLVVALFTCNLEGSKSIPEFSLTVTLIPELIRVHIGGISGVPKLLFLITQA